MRYHIPLFSFIKKNLSLLGVFKQEKYICYNSKPNHKYDLGKGV